jgi:hypothetical protein
VRGGGDRPFARGGDDRPFARGKDDRPFARSNDDRPFVRRPFVPAPPAEPVHSLRLRDGDRELEVSGSAAFVRHTLDELPVLLARLRGESGSRPASIAMPPPPQEEPSAGDGTADGSPPPGAASAEGAATAAGSADPLEGEIFALLRASNQPMPIAAIRKGLGGPVSSQQVRRVLERAADRVVASDSRPAAYRVR